MSTAYKLCTSIALSSLILVGCVSKVTDQTQYSGFVPGYEKLEEVSTPSGERTLRWMAPDFDPNAYDAIAFDKLIMYPAAKPSQRVSLQNLLELQKYADDSVKKMLAQKYTVVRTTDSKHDYAHTLIMHAAITGVSASNQGMRWYEVVPIAALIGGISAATGHRDQNTELYIEAYFVDGTTKEPLLKVVRKVFGEKLRNSSEPITANDFKPAIDGVVKDLKVLLK